MAFDHEQMTEQIAALERAAQLAAARAYCPYSGFPVGAALLADNGTIYAGCNVETGSYGLTICAERAAVTHMVGDGARRIEAIVVYVPRPEPVTPCGACRQVLGEFGTDARVIAVCDGPRRLDLSLGALLPHGFALGPPSPDAPAGP